MGSRKRAAGCCLRQRRELAHQAARVHGNEVVEGLEAELAGASLPGSHIAVAPVAVVEIVVVVAVHVVAVAVGYYMAPHKQHMGGS